MQLLEALDAVGARLTLSKSHVYRYDGKHVPGVTTIIKQMNAPALVRWMVKQERLAGMETAWKLLNDGYEHQDNKEAFEKHFSSLWDEEMAHEKIAREAADIGTQCHALIEKHLKDKLGIPFEITIPITDQAQSMFSTHWIPWQESVGLKPLAVERKLISEKHHYAGTGDLFAEIGGELSVCDWKGSTTQHVDTLFLEPIFQNVAYRSATEELTGQRWTGHVIKMARDGSGIKAHKIEPGPKDEWTIDDMLTGFLACRALYEVNTRFKRS